MNRSLAWLLLLMMTASGCVGEGDYMATKTVKSGDTIAVDYVGTFDDGTVFDTSKEDIAKKAGKYMEGRDYEPLQFEVGAGQMIAGFDKAVVGMKVGQTKKVSIPASEAYGEHDPEMVKKVPLGAFAESGLPPVGVTVSFSNGLNGKVLKINNDSVTVDFNNEMAGKDLNFEITLVKIL